MLQYRYQSYNQWTVQSAPQTPYSSPQLRRQVYQHCLVNLKNDQTLIDEITQRVLSKISEQIKLQILGANACTSTASIEGAVKRAIDQEMNEIEQNHDEKDAEMPVDNRNCDKSTKETGRESKKCKIDIVESAGDKILADPVQTSAKDDEIEDCKKVVQELLPTVTESTKKVIQIISNVLVQEKDPGKR